MPKLYVANPTQQIHQFSYSIPEATRHLIQEIPIGGQILVAGRDMPVPVIDSILDQHKRFGLVTHNEASRAQTFSGLVYSVDKPVPLQVLYDLVNKHRGLMIDRGRNAQRAAAIATSEFIEQAMQNAQLPGRMNELEVSVEEVSRDPRDPSPEVSEGTRVVADVRNFERSQVENDGKLARGGRGSRGRNRPAASRAQA